MGPRVNTNRDNLQVGDEVIVWHVGGWRSEGSLQKVERATTTMLTVGGARYMRRTGRLVGSKYLGRRIEVATDEERKALAVATAVNVMLRRINIARRELEAMKVGEDNIDAIEALIKSQKTA